MEQWPFNSTKKHNPILWTCVILGLAAGFVWWQMELLGKGLRTFHF